MLLNAPPTIDLRPADFQRACTALVERTAGFDPDVVVGIATGGVHVADAMQPAWSDPPARVDFRMQRPGTAAKERLSVGKLLRRLPTRTANRLRWLEVELRERSLKPLEVLTPDAALQRAAALTDADRATLAAAQRILVVDDTVDSGRTLSMTAAIMQACAPAADVRTAVLTSTWVTPPVTADFSLYERTLLRFPWSFDS